MTPTGIAAIAGVGATIGVAAYFVHWFAGLLVALAWCWVIWKVLDGLET